MLNCTDFVQAEACHGKFYVSEGLPSPLTKNLVGRQANKESADYFNKLCSYTESETEVYSLQELQGKMIEIAGGENVYKVYSTKWLKTKLQQKFGDHVFFSEINGKSNVACFRNMANTIITDKWYEDKNSNIDDEAKRIVTTAAKLIKSQIEEKNYSADFYLSTEKISDLKGQMPSYLNLFMETLFPCEFKQSSISQCILKVVKPRSIIPAIPFGLGVELDHIFGSRWLIDELYKLGFRVIQ